MASIKALLNDFNSIDIEINNIYYGGVVKELFIYDEEKREKLEIVSVDRYENHTLYKTITPYEISLEKEYEISTENGLRIPMNIGSIIRTESFEKMYYYDGDDLGNTYTKEKTSFKLWSPVASRVMIDIKSPHFNSVVEMVRTDRGVWSAVVDVDLELAEYNYLLKINDSWNETTDPYAYTSTPNTKKSVIVDTEKTKVNLNLEKRNKLINFTDAIIYEIHVRDLSTSTASGIKDKGKFLGAIKKGSKNSYGMSTGFDYINDLGITHIQFLPIYDFGSVDEENQFDFYNWGYDPVAYNVPEGSYASDVYDPYSRIVDLKRMIAKYHEFGLRVNMDVVYNHMFDIATSSFEKIVPGYYFRHGENGEVSNGSFCGNDIESRNLMVRKYIVDSVKRWAEFYGVDGFRFDLMGIIDIDTMNLIRTELDKIDESIMLYGEGWNMPTMMDDSQKASMQNTDKMPTIAHFNDRFRDAINGGASESSVHEKGLMSGNTDKMYLANSLLTGSCLDLDAGKMFADAGHSINYIECHDNYTIWDKLSLCCDDTDEQTKREMQKLGTAFVILSQGIPLLHAGQEFCETKFGDHNSYKSDDSVNSLDWDRAWNYKEVVDFVKNIIQIRKENSLFRLESPEEIKEKIYVSINNDLISYKLADENNEIIVLFNPTYKEYEYNLQGEYEILLNGDKKGIMTDKVFVNRFSVTVLKKQGENL